MAFNDFLHNTFTMKNGTSFGAAFGNAWKGMTSSFTSAILGPTGIGSALSMFGFGADDEEYKQERYLLRPQTLISFDKLMSNTVGKQNKGNIQYNGIYPIDTKLETGELDKDGNPKTRTVNYTSFGDSVNISEAGKNSYLYEGYKDRIINNSNYPLYAANLNAKMSSYVVNTENANELQFKMPDWGYQDFINERALWQKSIYSGVGEKGWFYFKIFFNFDTQYGLFGGLLNDDTYVSSANSASKYLYYSNKLYPQEKLNDRIIALHKFASILSFISSNAPWFFKSVKNLNTANTPLLTELTKEKSFEIEFNPDSIDMRISTLFDLYKFACFDDIGQKEIVPENLRKFDMSVVLFETPIRYLHTAAYSRLYGKFKYKTLNPSEGYDKMMSCKIFHFMNCEFDLASLGNLVPSQVSNEQPFEIGNGSIKINYDRVYTHTMNEFMEVMFGSDGMYYNSQAIKGIDKDESGGIKGRDDGSQSGRYLSLQTALFNSRKNPTNPAQFKELVDASESICHYNLMTVGGNVLGNLSSSGSLTGINHFDEHGKFIKDGKASPYFQLKQILLNNHQMNFSAKANYAISFVDSTEMSGQEKDLCTDLINYFFSCSSSIYSMNKVAEGFVAGNQAAAKTINTVNNVITNSLS